MITERFIESLYNNNQKQFMNRTLLYLSPCIGYYGSDFIKSLREFSVVSSGIADQEKNIAYGPSIFYLLNIERSRVKNFIPTIVYFRRHKSYLDDYMFGETLYSKLHMLVLKIPAIHEQAYYNFILGAYSKMYGKEALRLFHIKPTDSLAIQKRKRRAFRVLSLNDEERERIAEEYGVSSSLVTELDSKPKVQEEVFNFSLDNMELAEYFNRSTFHSSEIINPKYNDI